MKAISLVGVLYLATTEFAVPIARACGEEEVWLTQEGVAALKAGKKIHLLENVSFYYMSAAPVTATDPWAWLYASAATQTNESELGAARILLLELAEAPLEFDLIRAASTGAVAATTDSIVRQVRDQNLQRVTIACDGSVLIDSAHL